MRIVNAIKKIRLKDLAAPLIFVLLLIPSFVFRALNKIRGRKLWLVAEEGDARDNGYHFYKYIRENHPKDYCFYAIKKESAGFEKVNKLGNVIKWGSLKHWLFYMSANLNISSQKSGNPCPIFWYVIHVTLGLYCNRLFLQHGVIHNDAEWLYFDKTKFKYFVCSTKNEYDFILKKFGYKANSLLMSGLPRWDNLNRNSNQDTKSILLIPTWRKWLGGERNTLFSVKDFESSDFYKNWNALLQDKEFIDYIEKNNIKVYFYPHINMRGFVDSFTSKSKNIVIIKGEEDIQKMFEKCQVMVTDYSSVAFDFAYLDKPVVYYQFDKKEFENRQYKKGYFDHKKDGFGPFATNLRECIKAIREVSDSGISEKHRLNIEKTYTTRDCNNSQRLYNMTVEREND